MKLGVQADIYSRRGSILRTINMMEIPPWGMEANANVTLNCPLDCIDIDEGVESTQNAWVGIAVEAHCGVV